MGGNPDGRAVLFAFLVEDKVEDESQDIGEDVVCQNLEVK
jgi:hypothetical protein